MKVKINESQFDLVIKNKLHEAMGFGDDKSGAVELDKSAASNPSIVKKYTDQGINVKQIDEDQYNGLDETILDETLGDEQEVNLKSRFKGKKLNVLCTRDKVTTREVLEYINKLDDQKSVERAFEEGEVNLFVKTPSSGRYKLLGKFDKNALNMFKGILNKNSETPTDSLELNEEFFAE